MFGILVYAVIILLLGGTAYGDTGSEVPLSCPLKCDLLHEIQTLRQLVNQESILRMGIDAQMQDLRKTITNAPKELRQNGQLFNSSLDDIATVVLRLEKDTDTRIKDLNSSVQMTQGSITAVQNGQTDLMQRLMALEKEFASLNKTLQRQGICTFITEWVLDVLAVLRAIQNIIV